MKTETVTITVNYQPNVKPGHPDNPGMGECAAEAWEQVKGLMCLPPHTKLKAAPWEEEKTARELLINSLSDLIQYSLTRQFESISRTDRKETK